MALAAHTRAEAMAEANVRWVGKETIDAIDITDRDDIVVAYFYPEENHWEAPPWVEAISPDT